MLVLEIDIGAGGLIASTPPRSRTTSAFELGGTAGHGSRAAGAVGRARSGYAVRSFKGADAATGWRVRSLAVETGVAVTH
jgi:hypothetical protein